ncbi:hypothetical protein BH10ACT9_BH10ACT9_36490 [soil metagenome]
MTTTDTLNRQGGWFDLLTSGYVITGGDVGGYHGESDAIVSKTSDGADLNELYGQFRDVLKIWNDNLDTLVNLISYRTVSPAEYLLQSADGARMEKASEFGVPKGVKNEPATIVGFDFEDYDIATRWSYRFLRSASKAQVQSSFDNILSGHNKAVVSAVLQRLFNNSPVITPEGNQAVGLWAGDMKPPSHLGKTFAADHNHYLVSGATSVDSEDIEGLQNIVTEHGYGKTQGSQLLLLCNDVEAEKIASYRAGVVSANTKVAKYDFIPSSSAPAYLTDKTIVGSVAPGELSGLEVIGSYGRLWVVPHSAVPEGYLSVVASAGANSAANPIGFREHYDEAHRGLKLVPGNWQGYPLIESLGYAGFGCGTRHRGAAAVMQIKASGSYEVPTIAL